MATRKRRRRRCPEATKPLAALMTMVQVGAGSALKPPPGLPEPLMRFFVGVQAHAFTGSIYGWN